MNYTVNCLFIVLWIIFLNSVVTVRVGVAEFEPRSSEVDSQQQCLTPEAPATSANFDAADTNNAEDSIFLNDDMELEEALEEFNGFDFLAGGQPDVRREPAANGRRTSAPAAPGLQTSSGNNSVRLTGARRNSSSEQAT